MPALTDVKVSDDLTVIERGFDVYYRIPDGEKPKEGDLFYVTKSSESYVSENEAYVVVAVEGDKGCLSDNDGDWLDCVVSDGVDYRDGVFFRKDTSVHRQLAVLRRKQAEIGLRIAEIEAEIERQLSALKPDDYVKITSADEGEGSYGQLVRNQPHALFPYMVRLIPSNVEVEVMSVEPATAAEAAEYLRKVADSLT